VKNRVSDNVGGVNDFLSTPLRALRIERHFAVDYNCRYGWACLAMQFRWPSFVRSLSPPFPSGVTSADRKHELEPAPDFLFERTPFRSECVDRTPNRGGISERGHRCVVVSKNQAPYLLTRSEQFTFSCAEVPALTITAEPSSSVAVGATGESDWSIHFCARGEGQSEAEARERLETISMSRLGSTVSINGPRLGERPRASGFALVDAPTDAPLVIHASFAAVKVRDMSGSIRITATHARATILDSTGKIDANAFVADFAGSRGQINLSAESEINLKMTSPRFDGNLSAWAQRSVRMLIPRSFNTSFQATVSRPQDFICRAELCSKVKQAKKNGLYVFTYAGGGSVSDPAVQLRSEQSAIVIDDTDRKKMI
jgi:hypothetical protein